MATTNKAALPDEQEADPLRSGQRSGPLSKVLTMRVVVLFGLMRRSIVRRQRQLFGLSETEWRIITQLGPFAPLSLNGLADLLLQDRGQLSRAVKGLVERGLVTRRRKPGGPEIELALSEEGDELYRQMTIRAIERDKNLTDGIDEKDLAAAKRVIEEMIVRSEKLMQADEPAS